MSRVHRDLRLICIAVLGLTAFLSNLAASGAATLWIYPYVRGCLLEIITRCLQAALLAGGGLILYQFVQINENRGAKSVKLTIALLAITLASAGIVTRLAPPAIAFSRCAYHNAKESPCYITIDKATECQLQSIDTKLRSLTEMKLFYEYDDFDQCTSDSKK